jgi:hypothetical protein
MTSRAVKTLAPFDFRADFGPQPDPVPVETDPARVSFTGAELAGLIAQVRAETLAEVAKRAAETESERLSKVTRDLTLALGEIVEVMSQIESAAFDAGAEARLAGLIETVAGRLVRGQRDLFELAGPGAGAPPAEGM